MILKTAVIRVNYQKDNVETTSNKKPYNDPEI